MAPDSTYKDRLLEFVHMEYGLESATRHGFQAVLSTADLEKLAQYALRAISIETPMIAHHHATRLGLEI